MGSAGPNETWKVAEVGWLAYFKIDLLSCQHRLSIKHLFRNISRACSLIVLRRLKSAHFCQSNAMSWPLHFIINLLIFESVDVQYLFPVYLTTLLVTESTSLVLANKSLSKCKLFSGWVFVSEHQRDYVEDWLTNAWLMGKDVKGSCCGVSMPGLRKNVRIAGIWTDIWTRFTASSLRCDFSFRFPCQL